MADKILVPLDIEAQKTGGEALALARDFAEARDGQVVLLHVLESMPSYVASHLPADFRASVKETARKNLAAAAASHGLAGTAEIIVIEGNPGTEILDYADTADVQLIVIPSHDPGLADYLLGSVAARVVRHAHCSVLVVRHRRD